MRRWRTLKNLLSVRRAAVGRPERLCPTEESFLGTVDSRALWLQLALTPAQVGMLTGIPARRIRQWIEREWLVPSSRNPTRCSGQTVEQAIFLDRALTHGVAPEHAVHLVRAHQLRQIMRQEHGLLSGKQRPAQRQLRSAQEHEFAEAALRMLLLDLLEAEGAPDSPGAA